MLHFLHLFFHFLCADQLKEFQQKSSPTSVGVEKGGGGGGGGGGGAGAKKKRKVKGLNQHDASSTGRNSPDNVSQSGRSFYLFSCLIFRLCRSVFCVILMSD